MVIGIVVIGLLLSGLLVYRITRTLPNVNTLANQTRSSVIYDRNGQPVTFLWGQTSIPVSLSQIPTSLQDAIVATEDNRFYQNSGIDFRSIIRSALADVIHLGASQGGSTITEQLAKIHYLTNEKTITRKIAEVLLGIEIAHTYTKHEILRMYLNQVYLGEGASGVAAAARIYFNEPVSKLTLAQSALIAGLPKAPSAYDPFVHLSAAKARQGVVLQNMVTYGYITQAQANAAFHAPLNFNRGILNVTTRYPDPWFVDSVVNFLLKHGFSMHELSTGGLKIYTTLDPAIQADADQAVADVMNKGFPPPKNSSAAPLEPEAAVVVMDPRNGYVLAIVGGRQHTNILGFNRATDAHRQPGSSIKPLVEYPTAIEDGYTQASVIDDGPWMLVNNKPWPQNDNHQYLGRITLQDALAQSDNNAAVRLLKMVGIKNGYDTATKQFGLQLVGSGKYNDMTLAMGIGGLTNGVSPLEMAAAYSTYATEGYRPTPLLVTKVVAPDGQILLQDAPHLAPELNRQVAYIMIQMMEAVIQYGTGQGGQLGRPEAGKTGTAENGQDGWFIGFVPQLVTAVWEGYDTPKPQNGVFGATYALPIWTEIMKKALANVPAQDFPQPSGIVQANVDLKSGLLPSPLTPPADISTFDFISGTQPTAQSQVWVSETVDAQHPTELWAPDCAPDTPETGVFLQPPTDILLGPTLPLPHDANLWAPTTYCDGTSTSGGPTTPNTYTITIQAGQATPTNLTVTQGSTISLTITNSDNNAYSFVFPFFGVGVQTIPQQGSDTVTFTPTQQGPFNFTITPIGPGTPITGTINVSPAPNGG